MFDVVGMIRRATREAGPEAIAIAAPYELSSHLCRTLVESGAVRGAVLDQPPSDGQVDDAVAGWWLGGSTKRWFLRPSVPKKLVLFGATTGEELSGQMLMEARLKGVRTILMVHHDGSVLIEVDTAEEIARRLDSPVSISFGERTYDAVFREIYDLVGDTWRLPAADFEPRRAVLTLGSLGAGGAERQAAFSAVGLMESGRYEPIVACSHLSPPADFFRPVLERAGVQVELIQQGLPEFETPEILSIRTRMMNYDSLGAQNIFYQIFHYAMMIRQLKPTILHTWMDYSNVLAGIAGDLVGVPRLIMSGRSVAPHHFPEAVHQPYMRPGYHAIMSRRQVTFLNNSRAGAKDYALWLGAPESQFRVINNGFEFPADMPPATRKKVRADYGFAKDTVVIGTVTRFSEEKNPKLLIDSVIALSKANPNVRLLAFGQGVQFQAMKDYVSELGMADIIKLPGYTSDVWSVLEGMDVFALTSRLEGLPNVLVEAQAAGLPIVCTATGGMSETYLEGETGIGAPNAGPPEFALALGRLVEDADLRKRMGRAAKAFAREQFGIGKMVEHTLEAYAETPAVS